MSSMVIPLNKQDFITNCCPVHKHVYILPLFQSCYHCLHNHRKRTFHIR